MKDREGDALRVAVLFGGPSGEHEVSVESGRMVLEALSGGDAKWFDPRDECGTSPRPVSPIPLYWRRDGQWSVSPPGAADPEVHSPAGPGARLEQLRRFSDLLHEESIEVIFVALHGRGGEDGVVQGLLDLTGIPYTGSGVRASSVAFDKRLTKKILASEGIPVAPHVEIRRTERDETNWRDRVLESVGIPCVAKVADSGSSLSVLPVSDAEQLLSAIRQVHASGPVCLIEPRLSGTELTVSVLGNPEGTEDDAPRALPVTEIVPRNSDFFDYRAKYTPGQTEEITPARLDLETTREVQRLAVACHRTLGCSGATRTDLILTKEGPRVLEINTLPGLTKTSLLPQAAAAESLSFEKLVLRLIDLALLERRSSDVVTQFG